ncbi:hypothetical protein A0U40_18700 [[Bacillus] sp. KCTC 13219]|nr:hypothetical protein A0U40_18700 [[Bacillus] sp. KCTC 13219]
MTTESNIEKTVSTAKKTNSKEAIKGEAMFSREEILQNPQAFEVSAYVLVGAMANMNDAEYSKSQVAAAIKKFVGRKVEQK